MTMTKESHFHCCSGQFSYDQEKSKPENKPYKVECTPGNGTEKQGQRLHGAHCFTELFGYMC